MVYKYELDKYFEEKFNLRHSIFKVNSDDIVDNITGKVIISDINRREIHMANAEADNICDFIYKWYNGRFGYSILDAFKIGCSATDYTNYLEIIKWKPTRNPYTGNIVNMFSKNPPFGVSERAYKDGVVDYCYSKGYFGRTKSEIRYNIFKDTSNIVFEEQYAEICIQAEMKYPPIKQYGLNCIAYRDKMSYGNGFKYGQYFRPAGKLNTFLNSLGIKKVFNKAWISNENSEVLLISMSGYHFITTIDMLAKDLNVDRVILKDYIGGV